MSRKFEVGDLVKLNPKTADIGGFRAGISITEDVARLVWSITYKESANRDGWYAIRLHPLYEGIVDISGFASVYKAYELLSLEECMSDEQV